MAGELGRPTKYRAEYCQQLIVHMESGLSFESFAGTIDTHEETLYEWAKKYPDFSEAKKIGRSKCRVFWEKNGVQGTWGGKEFVPAAWIFNMRNRFGWSDTQFSGNDDKDDMTFKLSYEVKKKKKDDEK